MPQRFALSIIADLGMLGEQEVEVTGTYAPGTPDVMYLPNGDPGYPGDPEEFETTKVMWGDIDLTEHLCNHATFRTIVADEARAIYADSDDDLPPED